MIITLTTDFGLYDNFVGVMKGVILSIAPQVSIVDICHNIPPQDVRKADLMISSTIAYFPKDTLHVIVVDPGVGSNRRILYVSAYGHHFLAPDNGVLSSLENIEMVRKVENARFFLDGVSSTFHGRDIFAPVAAHIANGIEPSLLGPLLDPKEMKRFSPLSLRMDKENKKVYGSIQDIDHFGNIQTNISQDVLGKVVENRQNIRIYICDICISEIVTSYSDCSPQAYLALINSSMMLEIAKNLGNAARDLEAKVGMDVVVAY